VKKEEKLHLKRIQVKKRNSGLSTPFLLAPIQSWERPTEQQNPRHMFAVLCPSKKTQI
jgi:hypothetical protein